MNPDTRDHLVKMIKPPDTLQQKIEAAAGELRSKVSSIENTPPIHRFKPPGSTSTIDSAVQEYHNTYSKTSLDDIVATDKIDRDQINTTYGVAICEAPKGRVGELDLSDIFKTVMIRLFGLENLEVKAFNSRKSETIDWEEGPIAIISGASKVELKDKGKLVCIIVNYEKKKTI